MSYRTCHEIVNRSVRHSFNATGKRALADNRKELSPARIQTHTTVSCWISHSGTQIIYLHENVRIQIYVHTHTHTCFRIPAAISWPQSKMMWNSFPLFISFNSGLASLVSAGSCRIFNRMLYREGAFISSCNRIRPAGKNEQRKKIHFNVFFCLKSHRYLKNLHNCSRRSLAPMTAMNFLKGNFKCIFPQ